jgi:hypothetical protein
LVSWLPRAMDRPEVAECFFVGLGSDRKIAIAGGTDEPEVPVLPLLPPLEPEVIELPIVELLPAIGAVHELT